MTTPVSFSRVVEDAAAALGLALDRELTGYAEFTPQDALLLDDGGAGVLAFEAGVPTHVKHSGSGRGGDAALGDLAVPGPLRVECYAGGDPPVPETEQFAVAPGTPAERLAGDADLADRTRAAAPADGSQGGESMDAVEAFLEDDEKIDALRERAREEATERASEWGFEEFAED
ncbi:hypothetical protein [Halobacterium jilantaiense]|uniref:DUF8054 domain-containing protein n=1 Tax=Halobacterium jilantaiense TaxID=355548 RepID=A0A1I0P1B6_9EURY|nr:hypothetical protein [Halobacterium jilantaiense]SEW08130.1 hypothetical protein SAMN04487945_1330 [Halobacterium jilantaiense]